MKQGGHATLLQHSALTLYHFLLTASTGSCTDCASGTAVHLAGTLWRPVAPPAPLLHPCCAVSDTPRLLTCSINSYSYEKRPFGTVLNQRACLVSRPSDPTLGAHA